MHPYCVKLKFSDVYKSLIFRLLNHMSVRQIKFSPWLDLMLNAYTKLLVSLSLSLSSCYM